MRIGQTALLALASPILLAGCASATYSCGVPEGTTCRSVSEVYAAAEAGTLPRRHARPAGETQEADAGAMVPRRSGVPVATVEPGDPILSRPRHIRVWIARWQDDAGDMHDETYLYLRLDNGAWVLTP